VSGNNKATAVAFVGVATLALLTGCAQGPALPAAPSFSAPALPYYYARPVEPWAVSAEREGYGLPDTEDAPKAAPAPRRSRRKPVASDIPVAVNPPPSFAPASSPNNPSKDCEGWWRLCAIF
jgi:hypothetical protein